MSAHPPWQAAAHDQLGALDAAWAQLHASLSQDPFDAAAVEALLEALRFAGWPRRAVRALICQGLAGEEWDAYSEAAQNHLDGVYTGVIGWCAAPCILRCADDPLDMPLRQWVLEEPWQ